MSYGNTTEDALERENEDGIGRLGDKVRMLREMSNGLNDTMKEDNRLLGMMDGQFDGVGSMLGSAGDKIAVRGAVPRCCRAGNEVLASRRA